MLHFASEKAKLQPEVAHQPTTQPSVTSEIKAKLSKIEIAKFEGQTSDWLRFWSQFEESTDKRDIASINKLGYLQGYLSTKVRALISGLSYSEEGYEETKEILKKKYGRPADIIKHYIKEITELSSPGRDIKKMYEFADKLSVAVQSLKTLGKLAETRGLAQTTLEKLSGIRNDLIGSAENFDEWGYEELLKALEMWMRKNPVSEYKIDPAPRPYPRKAYTTQLRNSQDRRVCAYCEETTHKTTECPKVSDVEDRKRILIEKRLCFNCAKPNCRVSRCPSNARCRRCQSKHHTSLHVDSPIEQDTANDSKKNALTANIEGEGLLPIIVVEVNGVKCRALVDSGAGSSYASRTILNMIQAKSTKTEYQTIEMMLTSKKVLLHKYKANVASLDGNYELEVELTGVDKPTLLEINNPHYDQLLQRYKYLKGVYLNDQIDKPVLPIHVVLGAGDYARIKTKAQPLIGQEREPIAEKTRLGWFLMSPGAEIKQPVLMFAQTSQSDYEDLSRLDVLGLADHAENDQQAVFQEFKEQLLERKLHKTGLYDTYDAVIQEQKEEEVIEPEFKQAGEREFYIPHRAVVRETAATTKLRVVYDASARASPDSPFLNECLNPGPALQNELRGVLVRQRLFAIALNGDLRRA